jgi:hypothetical protein
MVQPGGKIKVRSTNFLIQFEIKKNCLRSGSNLLLYLFTKGTIKVIVLVIVHSSLEVNSIGTDEG